MTTDEQLAILKWTQRQIIDARDHHQYPQSKLIHMEVQTGEWISELESKRDLDILASREVILP